jgi:hypothetical protein
MSPVTELHWQPGVDAGCCCAAKALLRGPPLADADLAACLTPSAQSLHLP